MLRHTFFGLVGAAFVGFAALAPQAAQARDVSVTLVSEDGFRGGYGHGGGYGGFDRPRFDRPHFDRPFYGRPVAERPHWGGPGRGFGGDCVVRVNRYFDGYAWVKERRRICR